MTARPAAALALATALALAAALALPATARAQACVTPAASGGSCDLDVQLRMAAPEVMRLEMSHPTLDLGAPSLEDFARGFRDVAGPVVSVRANRSYRVEMAAEPAAFRYRGAHADPGKPASQLRWGLTPGSHPFHLGAPGTLIGASPAGPARGGAPASARPHFRVLWSLETDPPGVYELDVRVTISAP